MKKIKKKRTKIRSKQDKLDFIDEKIREVEESENKQNKFKSAMFATGRGFKFVGQKTYKGICFAGKWTKESVLALAERIKNLRSELNELNELSAELAAQMQLSMDKAELLQVAKKLEENAKQVRKIAKQLDKLQNIQSSLQAEEASA